MALTVEQYYIFALCVMGFALSVGLSICILAFIKLCVLDSSSWIDKTYRDLTMIAILSFTCCGIGDFTKTLVRFLEYPDTPQSASNVFEEIMIIGNDIVYYIGNITFYTLLLQRIKAIFGLKGYLLNVLLVLIGIYVITAIIYCVMIYFVLNNPGNWRFLGYSMAILSVDDVLLNVSLFFIFFRKLRSSIIEIDDINSKIMTKNYQNQVNLILNVMIKHCVLFGIALIVNEFFFGYNIYLFLYLKHRTIEQSSIDSYLVRTVENGMTILILWLVLKINYNQYICICKYCHICIGKCYIKEETTVNGNPYRELEDL